MLLLVLLLSSSVRASPGTTLHLIPLLGRSLEVGVPSSSGGADLAGPRDVTRPAISLRDGDERHCQVLNAEASDLVFALALSGPSATDWTLDVALGNRPLAREALSAKRWNMWTPFVVPVPQGSLDLRFEARQTGASGPRGPSLLVGSPRLEHRPSGRAPRVITWVSQDALGADHLKSYGYSRETTPFFTELARSMVVFKDAVAPATWTLPALASTFTSRYPPFHGATGEASARDESTPTLFEVLAGAGFTTLGVTGNRYVGPYFHMVDGFDAVFYTPGHAEDVVREVEKALDEWHGGDLILFVHFMDNHYPYEPPPPQNTAFDSTYRGSIDGRNFFEHRKELSPRDVKHVRALYDGAALHADAEIRRLFLALESRGVPNESILVYSADHGEGFLEHGRFLHAGTVYRELTHVPFALRLPAVAPRSVETVVSLLDLAPTLLEALGIDRPPSFSGRSLLPLMRGEPFPERPVLCETQVTNNNASWKVAACTERECLLVKLPRRSGSTEAWRAERFDRMKDPWQTHPLPEEEGALKTYLTAYIQAARTQAARVSPAEIPPEVRERLRALGYLRE